MCIIFEIGQMTQPKGGVEWILDRCLDTVDSTVNKGDSWPPRSSSSKATHIPRLHSEIHQRGQVSAQIIWIHCPTLLRFSAGFTDFLYWNTDSSTRTKPKMPVIQTIHKVMFRLLILAPIYCILRFQVFSILKLCHLQCVHHLIEKQQIWSPTTVCPNWF